MAEEKLETTITEEDDFEFGNEKKADEGAAGESEKKDTDSNAFTDDDEGKTDENKTDEGKSDESKKDESKKEAIFVLCCT